MNRELIHLIPFEKTAQTAKYKLLTELRLIPSGLALRYFVRGPIAEIHLPKPVKAGAYQEGLWEETCFEVFLQSEGSSSYIEWNFSPSGNYWNMGFSGPRIRDEQFSSLRPLKEIQVKFSETELQLEVEVPLIRLPCQLAACTILKFRDQSSSHWALKHADSKPNFHNPKSWVHYLES